MENFAYNNIEETEVWILNGRHIISYKEICEHCNKLDYLCDYCGGCPDCCEMITNREFSILSGKKDYKE